MDYFTGDLGAGGGAQCSAELQFRGRLGEQFVSFAMRRANRLSLRGWIDAGSAERITVVVEGPEALVDSFELVCSLGPIDSDVESWTRRDRAPGLNLETFEYRR